MFNVVVLEKPITRAELRRIASEGFGDMVKAVADVEKEYLALGGELHVDIQALLMEQKSSLSSDTWGVNLYLDKEGEEFLEFDSMVNLKPAYGNRTRGVKDIKIQDKIRAIVKKFII